MELLISLKPKLLKFIELSGNERLEFFKYLFVFAIFLPFYRTFGYKITRNIVDKLIKTPILNIRDNCVSNVNKHSNIIIYFLRNIAFKSSCLEKSLFIYFMLGLKGIQTEIKIGINTEDNKFLAHAWVEKEGVLLEGQTISLEKFSAF